MLPSHPSPVVRGFSAVTLASRTILQQRWHTGVTSRHCVAPQAHDGLMQYGAFGGLSPYAMVADGASVRATSAPAFDLAAAHPQYHPVGVAPHGPLLVPASSAVFDRHAVERIRSGLGAIRPARGSERHVL